MLGALVTVAAGVQTTRSSFQGQTANTGSLFAASTIAVGSNGAVVELDLEGLEPTTTAEDCVEVVYAGDLEAAAVRLYGRGLSLGGLEDYLLVRIEEGAAAPGGRCDRFEPDRVVFDGTAGQLLARHGDARSPFSSWEAVETGSLRAYRLRIGVASDNAAQGLETSFELIAEVGP